MSFTVGQMELEMGTFISLRSVMHSASSLFIRASVFGPFHLLPGFVVFGLGLFTVLSLNQFLVRIPEHNIVRSINVVINHVEFIEVKGSNILQFLGFPSHNGIWPPASPFRLPRGPLKADRCAAHNLFLRHSIPYASRACNGLS